MTPEKLFRNQIESLGIADEIDYSENEDQIVIVRS